MKTQQAILTLDFQNMTEVYLTTERLKRFHHRCVEFPGSAVVKSLMSQGEDALRAGPFSVVDKGVTPPSGDKHDFIRIPSYAWPDPSDDSGVSLVFRDGEPGPYCSSPDYDLARLREFTGAVTALAWASLASGEQRYASHAAHLLRVWFLCPETAMNPNLTFGKFRPDKPPPYTNGVIATHIWVELVQAVGILAGTEVWSQNDQAGLQAWFTQYVEWLQTSSQGLQEQRAANNRGVWYDAQLAAYSRFVGDNELTRRVIRDSATSRIDGLIAPDGSLPSELKRTRSLFYTLFALNAWSRLCLMGDCLDFDLWNWTSGDGRGLRMALDYVAPFVGSADAWKGQQISPTRFERAVLSFLAAAEAYEDRTLLEPLGRLPAEVLSHGPEAYLFSAELF